MEVQDFRKAIDRFNVDVIKTRQQHDYLSELSGKFALKIKSLENSNSVKEKASSVLAVAASTARDNAKMHFEKIITNALQFVTQDTGYEFIIADTAKTKASKPSYEFYVKSDVHGIECLQKPEEANGGGFVDIISTAAKYAYLEIFSDPKIMSATLLYDEPAKMVSAQMSLKFAEYIKFLGNHYGRQTIMITHNENLAGIADKTFVVQKHADGTSHVNEPADEDISKAVQALASEVEKYFEKEDTQE